MYFAWFLSYHLFPLEHVLMYISLMQRGEKLNFKQKISLEFMKRRSKGRQMKMSSENALNFNK